MATRKVRTGRKTKSMRTRTKSRRYKVRGGKSVNDMTDDEMAKLGGEIAAIWITLGTNGVTVKSIKEKIDAMLAAESITEYEH